MPKTKRPMPVFSKAPEALVVRFGEAVEKLPGVVARKMFGYPAAFTKGQMFAALFQSSCILRLDEKGRAEFAKKHGGKAFEPVPGRPMREYMAVPEDVLASAAGFSGWLLRARAYAASLPPKEKGPLGRSSGSKKR
jgi:TfoX/Sxy family transcriptional regulator of competence genes